VIVGNGSTNDLSFLRSLGRRGVPTIFCTGDRQLGSFSRYGLRIRLPAVEDDPREWLEVLHLSAALLKTRPVLFALSDPHCAFVSQNADILRRNFRFVLPDAETVECILNKKFQYTAAGAAGIRVPPTYYPDGVQEVIRLGCNIGYPVILKPYTAHLGRPLISNLKVLVIQSATDLVSAYSKCTDSGASFMVQQIVPGGDDNIFWYSAWWDERGRERAWFTGQKLRQFPPGFGDGSFQQTVEAPVVLEHSRDLLEAFRYRGLVSTEFKRDPRNGNYYLIEINARTMSGNQLGISAGVDLPWIAYCDLAGLDSPAPSRSLTINVRYVNEEWDVQAFWRLWKSKELTLASWLLSLRGTRAWALFAWDDPAPLLCGLWRFLSVLLRRVLRPPPRELGNVQPGDKKERERGRRKGGRAMRRKLPNGGSRFKVQS
jgi:predicted ATP-grasp superfamily ATP-dependent carboligase